MGAEAAVKPRITLLPILTVLFLISYGLLTMLVVEQAQTIDSQRGLIRQLFDDSVQLSALKGKAIQKQNADDQAAKARAKTQAPAAKAAPSTDTPHKDSRLRRPLPQKPPKDTSGESDERRM
jgi:hypothetical protein